MLQVYLLAPQCGIQTCLIRYTKMYKGTFERPLGHAEDLNLLNPLRGR